MSIGKEHLLEGRGDLEVRIRAIRALPAPGRLAVLRDVLKAASPAEMALYGVELVELALHRERSSPPDLRGNFLIKLRRGLGRWTAKEDEEIRRAACVELARAWERLPAEVHLAARAVDARAWAAALEPLAIAADAASRCSVLVLAARTCNVHLARHAARMLADDQREVAQAAEAALEMMTRRAASAWRNELKDLPPPALRRLGIEEDPAGGRLPPHEVAVLEHALVLALTGHAEHQRDSVLLAALLMLDPTVPDSPLMAWASDDESPGHAALRGFLRRSDEPIVRACALKLATLPSLRTACRDRLSKARSLPEHEGVLSRWHLLGSACRRRALAPGRSAKATSRAWPLPSGAMVPRLSDQAKVGLCVWTRLMGTPLEQREQVLGPLLIDANTAVRHAAARSVGSRRLEDFCYDADERVALSAALVASGAGVCAPGSPLAEPPRLFAMLRRSPHARVRAVAGQEMQPWAWTLDAPAARLALRRWLADDRAGAIAWLGGQWERADDQRRVPVVSQLVRLGVAGDFARVFEGVLAAGDASRARLAATVARASAGLPLPEGLRAVELALRWDEPRVRANALEAMTTLGRRGARAAGLVEFKLDGHHRVRAAAIRGLLEEDAGRGLEDLDRMLGDERPEHRLAAAWLAGRVVAQGRAGHLVATMERMARADADEAVRRRAARCPGVHASVAPFEGVEVKW